MDEDSVDDIMKKLEKSKEESTRTTLSQEEMRKNISENKIKEV